VRIVRSSRFWAAVLPIAILASACHTMRPLERSQLRANPDLQRVWVTRSDRSTVIVDRPELVGDTIEGQVAGRQERIPLSDVTTMQTRVVSGSKTRNLVLAIATVGAAGTVALLNAKSSQPKNGLCFVAADLPLVNCCLVDVSNGANPANC
jgi:hypothetical protein